MAKKKTVDAHASALGKRRWEGVPAAERTRIMTKAARERWRQAKRNGHGRKG